MREPVRDYHIETLGVPEEIVDSFSNYMKDVRFIHALDIAGHRSKRCVAVFCIDSRAPDALDPDVLDRVEDAAGLLSYIIE